MSDTRTLESQPSVSPDEITPFHDVVIPIGITTNPPTLQSGQPYMLKVDLQSVPTEDTIINVSVQAIATPQGGDRALSADATGAVEVTIQLKNALVTIREAGGREIEIAEEALVVIGLPIKKGVQHSTFQLTAPRVLRTTLLRITVVGHDANGNPGVSKFIDATIRP